MAINDPASERSLQDTVEELRETNKHLEIGFDPAQGEVFKLGKKVDNLPKSLATMIGNVSGGQSGGIGGTEKVREEAVARKKQETFFGFMLQSLKSIDNSLTKMLKIMTKEALGSIAGLLAAPIIAIVAFFSQLRKEWLALKMLTKWFLKENWLTKGIKLFGRMFGKTGPIGRFGIWLASYHTKDIEALRKIWTKLGKSLKDPMKPFTRNLTLFRTAFTNVGKTMGGVGKTVKVKEFSTVAGKFGAVLGTIRNIFQSIGKGVGTVGKGIMKGWNLVKGFFTSIGGFFSSITGWLSKNSAIFRSIKGIAGTIGSVLGKIFLPITIIMGIFDAVTGFMKGYKDEGTIFAGIREGLAKVVGNLIGMPLDLLKKGVSWLIEFFFGPNKVSESLDKLDFKKVVMDLVRLPFNLFQSAKKWLTSLFTWDENNPLIVGAENVSSFISKTWKSIMDKFKEIFSIDFKAIMSNILPEGKIGNWFRKKLGITEEDEKRGDLREEIKELDRKILNTEEAIKYGSQVGRDQELDRKILERLVREREALKAEQKQQVGQIVNAPIQANTQVGGDSTHVNATSNRHPIMVGAN